MNILSLDPSLSSTGYSIINSKKELLLKGRYQTTNKNTTDERIQMIIHFLENIDIEFDVVILEDGFVGFSRQTSLQLAELRGALIAYFKYKGYPVEHEQPKKIRMNFGLPGNAKKEEVANAVLSIYPNLLEEIGPYSDKSNKQKTSDIYDSISIGLSYINSRE